MKNNYVLVSVIVLEIGKNNISLIYTILFLIDNMFGNPMQSLSDEISALATDQIISPTPTTSTAALTFSPVPAQSITNKAEFDARFESLLLANQKKKRRAGLVSERTISVKKTLFSSISVFFHISFLLCSHVPMKNVLN